MPTLVTRGLPLAAFTLLPLVGVLLLGWDWREVLVLYWLENVSLGAAMLVRMIRAARGDGGSPIFPALFFAVHYGIFTLVHGVFVFAIVAGAFLPGLPSPATPLDGGGILLVWAVAGALQLVLAAISPLPAARGMRLMMSAYPRVIVLHLAILGSAFLIAILGLPAIAAVLLIVLHALVDGAGWMLAARRERAVSAAAGPASVPSPGD